MVYEHTNYRSYLKAVLAERMQRNRSYSLRAMAQQLGLVNSQLSEVMNGKANFSLSSAIKIATKIGLEERETEYFCAMIQLEAESDPRVRESFVQKLNRLREGQAAKRINDLSVDQFKQMSEWYHSAMLELLEIPGYVFEPALIARSLGITKIEAEVAIERLARLELITSTEGVWKRATDYLQVNSPTKNTAMRAFYRQMLEKAATALETQTPQERVSGYETFAISPEALPEAREATEKYFNELIRLSRKYPQKTEVYHALVHLFRVTHPKEGFKK